MYFLPLFWLYNATLYFSFAAYFLLWSPFSCQKHICPRLLAISKHLRLPLLPLSPLICLSSSLSSSESALFTPCLLSFLKENPTEIHHFKHWGWRHRIFFSHTSKLTATKLSIGGLNLYFREQCFKACIFPLLICFSRWLQRFFFFSPMGSTYSHYFPPQLSFIFIWGIVTVKLDAIWFK